MSKITAAKPHHIVLYARVAREDPAALDRQVASMRQTAHEHGWTEVQVVAESRSWGISARALSTVCSADIVVVTGMDRLARRLARLVEVQEVLATHGVRVATPGHVESEAQARFQLALLRMRADVGQVQRRTVPPVQTLPVCRLSADQEDVAAASSQDVLVNRMLDVHRQHERAEHARRTRAGMAAAKLRREARR
ncbi:recombinase family protein [Geodermatophilus sp. SYSU D00698]